MLQFDKGYFCPKSDAIVAFGLTAYIHPTKFQEVVQEAHVCDAELALLVHLHSDDILPSHVNPRAQHALLHDH